LGAGIAPEQAECPVTPGDCVFINKKATDSRTRKWHQSEHRPCRKLRSVDTGSSRAQFLAVSYVDCNRHGPVARLNRSRSMMKQCSHNAKQEIEMNELHEDHVAAESASNRVRLNMTIWVLTLGILFGGAILAKGIFLLEGTPEVTAQHSTVVAGRADSDSASPNGTNSATVASTAPRN
jgi:hypothetical protein